LEETGKRSNPATAFAQPLKASKDEDEYEYEYD
jgi:hypothetical protein